MHMVPYLAQDGFHGVDAIVSARFSSIVAAELGPVIVPQPSTRSKFPPIALKTEDKEATQIGIPFLPKFSHS